MKDQSKVNGGKAAAKVVKEKHLIAYLEDPHKCLCCGEEILPRPEEKIHAVKRRKFCNKSCAATYNNAISPKRRKIIKDAAYIEDMIWKSEPRMSTCIRCGDEFVVKRNEKTGEIRMHKICYKCKDEDVPIKERAKGDIFKTNKNWQSARNSIRRDAYKTFIKSGKAFICIICDYDKHSDVCHKKPVSDFSDDSLISEINDITNLVALCPNHHWEFDEGLISLEEIIAYELIALNKSTIETKPCPSPNLEK